MRRKHLALNHGGAGMDVLTATAVDRRAWAVEQAVRLHGTPQVVGPGGRLMGYPPVDVMETADRFLAYVNKPFAEVSIELLETARSYDGKQDAGALIGLLADALEQAMGRT